MQLPVLTVFARKKPKDYLSPSPKCYELIKHFEGFEDQAYPDGGGVWTVGYGFTRLWDRPIRKGDTISREAALQILIEKVEAVSDRVRKSLGDVKLKQYQFDALVSFAYNLGTTALRNSTLFRLVTQNPSSYVAIEHQFSLWVHVKGKISNGLIRRRKSESHLYKTGKLRFFES